MLSQLLVVKDQVDKLRREVGKAIDLACTSSNMPRGAGAGAGDAEQCSEFSFSASEYFFVSSGVAKEFPDLLESTLILSYTPPTLPSEAHLLDTEDGTQPVNDAEKKKKRGSVSYCSIALTLSLQALASQPMPVQKLLLQLIQPLVIAFIGAALSVISDPVVLAVVVTVLLVLFAMAVGFYVTSDRQQKAGRVGAETPSTAIGPQKPLIGPPKGQPAGPPIEPAVDEESPADSSNSHNASGTPTTAAAGAVNATDALADNLTTTAAAAAGGNSTAVSGGIETVPGIPDLSSSSGFDSEVGSKSHFGSWFGSDPSGFSASNDEFNFGSSGSSANGDDEFDFENGSN